MLQINLKHFESLLGKYTYKSTFSVFLDPPDCKTFLAATDSNDLTLPLLTVSIMQGAGMVACVIIPFSTFMHFTAFVALLHFIMKSLFVHIVFVRCCVPYVCVNLSKSQ